MQIQMNNIQIQIFAFKFKLLKWWLWADISAMSFVTE